jgi:hypothetical protein
MLSLLGSLVFFASVAGNVDSVFVDQVDSNVAVIEVVTGAGPEDWTTVEMPTVAGKRGLHEGQRIGCETVGPRLDGTRVIVCGGSVAAYIDIDGSRRGNPYYVAR